MLVLMAETVHEKILEDDELLLTFSEQQVRSLLDSTHTNHGGVSYAEAVWQGQVSLEGNITNRKDAHDLSLSRESWHMSVFCLPMIYTNEGTFVLLMQRTGGGRDNHSSTFTPPCGHVMNGNSPRQETMTELMAEGGVSQDLLSQEPILTGVVGRESIDSGKNRVNREVVFCSVATINTDLSPEMLLQDLLASSGIDSNEVKGLALVRLEHLMEVYTAEDESQRNAGMQIILDYHIDPLTNQIARSANGTHMPMRGTAAVIAAQIAGQIVG